MLTSYKPLPAEEQDQSLFRLQGLSISESKSGDVDLDILAPDENDLLQYNEQWISHKKNRTEYDLFKISSGYETPSVDISLEELNQALTEKTTLWKEAKNDDKRLYAAVVEYAQTCIQVAEHYKGLSKQYNSTTNAPEDNNLKEVVEKATRLYTDALSLLAQEMYKSAKKIGIKDDVRARKLLSLLLYCCRILKADPNIDVDKKKNPLLYLLKLASGVEPSANFIDANEKWLINSIRSYIKSTAVKGYKELYLALTQLIHGKLTVPLKQEYANIFIKIAEVSAENKDALLHLQEHKEDTPLNLLQKIIKEVISTEDTLQQCYQTVLQSNDHEEFHPVFTELDKLSTALFLPLKELYNSSANILKQFHALMAVFTDKNFIKYNDLMCSQILAHANLNDPLAQSIFSPVQRPGRYKLFLESMGKSIAEEFTDASRILSKVTTIYKSYLNQFNYHIALHEIDTEKERTEEAVKIKKPVAKPVPAPLDPEDADINIQPARNEAPQKPKWQIWAPVIAKILVGAALIAAASLLGPVGTLLGFAITKLLLGAGIAAVVAPFASKIWQGIKNKFNFSSTSRRYLGLGLSVVAGAALIGSGVGIPFSLALGGGAMAATLAACKAGCMALKRCFGGGSVNANNKTDNDLNEQLLQPPIDLGGSSISSVAGNGVTLSTAFTKRALAATAVKEVKTSEPATAVYETDSSSNYSHA
ncbi:MAG: hypothetical protein ABI597_12630, partial [Gammaproteobacteria bacterium]